MRAILSNEKYIGDCCFQKTYTDFRFKRHVNRKDKEQYYSNDHHVPIVSKEVFETAKAMVAQRAKEKNKVVCQERSTHSPVCLFAENVVPVSAEE